MHKRKRRSKPNWETTVIVIIAHRNLQAAPAPV
jgi:hypothetical protein